MRNMSPAWLAMAVVVWAASAGAQPCPSGLKAAGGAEGYEDVTVEQAHEMWLDGVFVLDVRTTAEVAQGHIPGAYHIDVNELPERLDEIAEHQDEDILVYCLRGGRSAQASGTLADNAFTGVHNMLGGIEAWIAAGYEVTDSAAEYDEVSVEEAYDMYQEGACVMDTRWALDYWLGHIPGACLVRSFELADRLEDLVDWKDKDVLVYCSSASCGNGAVACQLLADNGFTKVHLLTGGYEAWVRAGYEVERWGWPGLPLACTPGTLSGPRGGGPSGDVLVLALGLTALLGAGRLANRKRLTA